MLQAAQCTWHTASHSGLLHSGFPASRLGSGVTWQMKEQVWLLANLCDV